MKEMVEYRKQLVGRFERVMEDLPGALERLPPEAWDAAEASGEGLRRQIEHFCQVEQGVYFAMIEAILSSQAGGAASDLIYRTPPEPLCGEDPRAALAQIWVHSRSIIPRLGDLPVEVWNALLRHPQQGLRTLQWWVEQSLAYAGRQLQSDFSSL